MKKKVFLMSLMVVALFVVFAISAFAEDIIVSKTESAEYGTVIQLNSDPGLDNAEQYVSTLNKIDDAGTDKDALCILKDGNTDNPSYYVFPSSYIVDEREDGVFDLVATPLATAMAEFNLANGTEYYAEYATDGSGGGKRLNSTVRFVFPSSVVSASSSVCCMRSYSTLVEVRINHAINFSNAQQMFYNNKKLASVIGFENVDGTKLAKLMFGSCSALRYIKLPVNITAIPGSFFQGAQGVNVVNMAELTELTTIGSWAFDGTKNLVITLPDSVTKIETSAFESAFQTGGSITINPTSQLKSIGNVAFRASTNLTSIYIPSTVTSIGERAFESSGIKTLENFENCQITKLNNKVFDGTAIESIKIPPTVTEISTAFMSNSKLKLVYIPKSVTVIADTFTTEDTDVVFLYTGIDTSIFANCATLSGATIIPASEYDETASYTGINLVVGYSNCVAYNNSVHGELISDVVVTSYLEAISLNQTCTLCKMALETEKLGPLFTCLGYSANETGGDGIAIGYVVNNEAIDEYTSITGKSINYGVFVASQNKLGENDIFDQEGNKTGGVVSVEITSYEFAVFELKVVGFTDENKGSLLAMGAYVKEADGENAEYSYMQDDTNGEKLGNYYFVSYNSVVNSLS